MPPSVGSRRTPTLKDKALEDALQKQTWDPSVKSLAVFPQVLTMMSEKIDWTQKLGDAFLAQQKEVMATVQRAAAEGVGPGQSEGHRAAEGDHGKGRERRRSSRSSRRNPRWSTFRRTTRPSSTEAGGGLPIRRTPTTRPGYVAGGALLGFTAGVIVGGALWGGVNWGRGDVDIDVNRYNNFNRTNIQNNNWQHNASHRGAVPYKDKAVPSNTDAGSPPMRSRARRIAGGPRSGNRRSSAVTSRAIVSRAGVAGALVQRA